MAINLAARLTLNGNQFTSQMRRIQRQVQNANRVMQSMNTINTQLNRAMRTSSGAVSQLTTSSRSLTATQSQLRNAIQRNQSATTQLSTTQNRLQRQTQAASNATQQLNNSTNRMSRGFSVVNSTAGSTIRSIGSMTTAVIGLAGAYASVQGAKKVFESTVGEAAKYEQSSVIISAMLNDKQLGKDYMKLVDKFAVDSPILDSQGMLANSKSFLTQSKDMKQLKKMWSLAERMAAIDPVQGLEGSVFALREMFSGDAISMIRRFEMPRKVMNDIKNLDLEGQLAALDKYFSSIGMTQKLIDDMGGTTLGVWAQIKESTNVILRDLGAPALAKVKDFLNGIRTNMATVKEVMSARNLFSPEEYRERLNRAMNFEKFKETGAKILENVSTGFINAAKGITGWAEAITQSEDWKKANSLSAKIGIIFDDIWETFSNWVNGDGKPKIEKVATTLTQIMATAIESSSGPIIDVSLTLGKSFGKGIVDGAFSYVKENWASTIMSGITDGPAAKVVTSPIKGVEKYLDNKYDGGFSNAMDQAWDKVSGKLPSWVPGVPQKKNGGLNYVPYDGATYSLHRGETILPRGEADNYRRGNGGGKPFAINIANMHVRQESDIKAVAYELARLIETEGAQMA